MSKDKIPPPPSNNGIPKPPPSKEKPNKPEKEVVVEKEYIYLDNSVPKAPPSAVDLEEVIIGALLIDNRVNNEIIPILVVDIFYDQRHQEIYKCMKHLYDENTPIDLLTVSNELKRRGTWQRVGGDYYLIQLTQKVNSSAHTEHHMRIIQQKYILRQLIQLSRRIMFKSLHRDPDVFKMIEEIENVIAKVLHLTLKKNVQEDMSDEEDLEKRVAQVRKGENPGIYWGVSEFDDWSGGAQPRELRTIAARPGMGKTTIGLSIAASSAIDRGIPTAFFSLEMSKRDLNHRLSARLTGIDYSKIRKAQLSPGETEKVKQALAFIKTTQLTVIDTSSHKNVLEKIIADIRRLVKEGCRQVFIDYVQLIKLAKKTNDRTADLSEITRELKATANELNIPIIQFAQLNRSVDNRDNKMPTLADLKQSGSIEEDSDMVIFILRDAYYREKSQPGTEVPPHIAGDTQWIVAKGRNTGTRTFRTYIDFLKYSFQSYSDAHI